MTRTGHPKNLRRKSSFNFLSCFPGIRHLPEPDQRTAANVHYTLLIACVLVAFLLGAILSGFLVSCYCSRRADHRAKRLGKDPEASLPHALSLRSLAKLNGLLEGQPKVGGRCIWITCKNTKMCSLKSCSAKNIYHKNELYLCCMIKFKHRKYIQTFSTKTSL